MRGSFGLVRKDQIRNRQQDRHLYPTYSKLHSLRFADKLAGDAYTVMTASIAALYGVGSLVNGPIVSETVAKFLTKSDKVEVALENLRKENVKQLENTIKMMQK